jgi:hypothetical protein
MACDVLALERQMAFPAMANRLERCLPGPCNARIREHLTQRGLVYRYRRSDGLEGGEGTFAICTFWMVDNLALQGRVGEARGYCRRHTYSTVA